MIKEYEIALQACVLSLPLSFLLFIMESLKELLEFCKNCDTMNLNDDDRKNLFVA